MPHARAGLSWVPAVESARIITASAMSTLTLPEKSLAARDLDVRPGSVRDRLDSLPAAQPVAAAETLLAFVHRANRTPLTADHRLEFVQAVRPFAEMLADQLSRELAHAAIPLAGDQRRALDALRTLAGELSLACRAAVVDNAARLLAFSAKRHVPGLVVQAIDWLTAALLASYRTYTPVPAGTWRALHETYLYADESGFASQPVGEEVSRSPRSAFCEALLIALADPYRLSPAETHALLPCAAAAMEGATLTRDVPRSPSGAHFSVALDSDRPPRLAAAFGRGGNLRILDANAVIDRLRARRAALREAPSDGPAARRAEVALIDKLMALWGDPPRRGFRRGASESGVALCVGLVAVRHFIAKETADEMAQAEAIHRGITMPLIAVADDESPEAHPVLEWEVIDESAGGLKVRRSHPRQAVSVGEVVGVRMLGHPRWIVGVVRWMSGDDEGALDVGVQFIAPGAACVWLQPTITAMPHARPGLLLQGTGDDSAALLSPPDTFSELREFEMSHEGDGTSCVRALTLIERTARFEVFAFAEEKTARR